MNDNSPANESAEATFDPFRAVQDFYQVAGVTHSRETAHNLIREEAKEAIEAAAALLKELADLEYVLIGAIIQGHTEGLPEDVLSSVGKVGSLMNLIPEEIRQEAFKRVHESNMSKLVDGEVVRDPETGKILKGPNYKAPDLIDLI